jgi:polyhydroxyalkanoate synthesis regulator phasin
VCHNAFACTGERLPLSLPCGHTLCRDCNGRLIPRICPWCRVAVPDEVPPNYALVGLLTQSVASAVANAPEESQPTRRKPIGEMTIEELHAFRTEMATMAEAVKELEREACKRKRKGVEARHLTRIRELHAQHGAIKAETTTLSEKIRELRERGARVTAEGTERRRQLIDELRRENLLTPEETAAPALPDHGGAFGTRGRDEDEDSWEDAAEAEEAAEREWIGNANWAQSGPPSPGWGNYGPYHGTGSGGVPWYAIPQWPRYFPASIGHGYMGPAGPPPQPGWGDGYEGRGGSWYANAGWPQYLPPSGV